MARTPGLLCVHAHPDDEAVLTGGVLAQTSQRGLRAGVVTCTGGECGEIVGEGMDPDEVRPRLAEVRRQELTHSLELLGAGPPRFLGYRDSGMMGTADNDHPAALWQAHLDEAVERLVAEIRGFQPDVLVTYDAFGGYGHPDHIQAHRLTLVAAEAAATSALYPDAGDAWRTPKLYLGTLRKATIFEATKVMRERGLPLPFGEPETVDDVPAGARDDELGAVIDVMPWMEAKWAALRAHASQVGPDSFFLNVPEDLRDLMFGKECYVRYRSDVRADGVEDDLFAGIPGAGA